MNRDRAVQVTYFLLRVVAGLLFLQAGGLILFGWFGGMPGQSSPPPLMSQIGIGGVLEFFGGIAIMLGLGTRPVAFLSSGMMAVASISSPQGNSRQATSSSSVARPSAYWWSSVVCQSSSRLISRSVSS